MRDKNLLLLDFSNIVMKAVSVNGVLSHNGVFTGGLYGFITMLSSMVNECSVDRVIVCQDRRPYLRSKYYSGYKSNRKALDDETMMMVSQTKKLCSSFLDLLHIPTLAEGGWEADDLIAHVVLKRHKRYKTVLLGSSDADLYQLFISDRVKMIKKKGLYGRDEFVKDHGVRPSAWPKVIALAGSHNGVPGIRGVGPVTATKLIYDKAAMKKRLSNAGMSIDNYRLNKDLATLPFPNLPELGDPVRVEPIRYNERAFIKFLSVYGIRLTTPMARAFTRLSDR